VSVAKNLRDSGGAHLGRRRGTNVAEDLRRQRRSEVGQQGSRASLSDWKASQDGGRPMRQQNYSPRRGRESVRELRLSSVPAWTWAAGEQVSVAKNLRDSGGAHLGRIRGTNVDQPRSEVRQQGSRGSVGDWKAGEDGDDLRDGGTACLRALGGRSGAERPRA
jgi:hypothetical protein